MQYAASNSMSWVATDLTGTIQPGAYFLVAEAQGTGGTADLPTPQVTGALTMGGTSGKVALVRATSILGTSCATDAAVVDFVAYGSSTVCTSFTSSLSSTTSALRKDAGCGYSGVVATDFSVGPVSPRNATTPVVTCTVCN